MAKTSYRFQLLASWGPQLPSSHFCSVHLSLSEERVPVLSGVSQPGPSSEWGSAGPESWG